MGDEPTLSNVIEQARKAQQENEQKHDVQLEIRKEPSMAKEEEAPTEEAPTYTYTYVIFEGRVALGAAFWDKGENACIREIESRLEGTGITLRRVREFGLR